MIEDNIEHIVRRHVSFEQLSSTWNRLYCKVCGDGSHTSGPRGGWLFKDEMAFYHCFNCGADGNFDPTRMYPYSKDMYRILRAFDIPDAEHKTLVESHKSSGDAVKAPVRKQYTLEFVDIPDYFYKLSEAKDTNLIAKQARDFLLERKIDPNSYEFYLSNGKTVGTPKEEAIARSLVSRLIIPAYKDGKMIYYQARDMTGKASKKYLNMDAPKANIIYGYDKLYQNNDKPLFITEGFWDSHHLDGICTMGNEMSLAQQDIINRSPRKKIIVPDKKLKKEEIDKGHKLILQGLELGWSVSYPDFGSYKDVTESIQNYGKLYTLNTIMKNIYSDYAAEVKLNLW